MAVKLLLLPYNTNLAFTPEMETVASLMIGCTILLITIIMMTIGQIINIVTVFLNKVSLNQAMANGIPPLIVLSFFTLVYIFSSIELKKVNANT